MKPSINYPGWVRRVGGRRGAPAPRAGHFLALGRPTGSLRTWPETCGITCGNILQRSGPRSARQTAGVGALTSTPSVCVLNTFFFLLPGYVVAEANVYKFLTLRPAHCSGFRGLDDRALPAGNSL